MGRKRPLWAKPLAHSTGTVKSHTLCAEGCRAANTALRRRALRLTGSSSGRRTLRPDSAASGTARPAGTARSFTVWRTLRTLGTTAGLSRLSRLSAGWTTLGRLWPHLLLGDLTVVVLVQRQQRLGGIGDLLFVNLSVLIRIQRSDKGRHHGAESAASPASRSPGLSWLARQPTATAGRRLRRRGLCGRRRGFRRRGLGWFLREQRACSRQCAQQGVLRNEFHWLGVFRV